MGAAGVTRPEGLAVVAGAPSGAVCNSHGKLLMIVTAGAPAEGAGAGTGAGKGATIAPPVVAFR